MVVISRIRTWREDGNGASRALKGSNVASKKAVQSVLIRVRLIF
jgi:hypothetical protein